MMMRIALYEWILGCLVAGLLIAFALIFGPREYAAPGVFAAFVILPLAYLILAVAIRQHRGG